MKLKEKLAKEYANTESTCPVNDYLAGFEKARELAQAECTRFMEYELPEVIDIETRIGEIGEEEVKLD